MSVCVIVLNVVARYTIHDFRFSYLTHSGMCVFSRGNCYRISLFLSLFLSVPYCDVLSVCLNVCTFALFYKLFKCVLPYMSYYGSDDLFLTLIVMVE